MLFDIIGMIGVLMILGVYGAVQLDRMDVKTVTYSVLNALGAGLVIISLVIDFNLSAMVIETSWMVISIFGIVNALRRKTS